MNLEPVVLSSIQIQELMKQGRLKVVPTSKLQVTNFKVGTVTAPTPDASSVAGPSSASGLVAARLQVFQQNAVKCEAVSAIEAPRLTPDSGSGHLVPFTSQSSSSHLAQTDVDEKLEWSRAATLKMLSYYEVRKGSPGYSKRDKKLWAAIASDLNANAPKLFAKEVEWKQVKDKFSNLKSQINRKRDHNNRSGSDPKPLTDVEERILDILQLKNPEVGEPGAMSMSSPLFRSQSPATKDPLAIDDEPGTSSQALALCQQSPVSERYRFKPKRKHGTNSSVAKTKLQLETQWLASLKRQEERDKAMLMKYERDESYRKEYLALKGRKNELMAKYLAQKEIQARKKEDRFKKRMEVQQEQNRLLQALVDTKRDLETSY